MVGKTGTGKTTLARNLLDAYTYVCVHDAKGMLAWPGYRLYRTVAEVVRAREPRIIYRPTAYELRDPKAQQTFFHFIYLRRNTLLYVDEAYGVTSGNQLPPAYHACVTRGRERGIGVWTATQRPARIPLVILSEAEHCYLFRLRLERDRRRIEEEWGIPNAQQGRLEEHAFIYSTERIPQPRGPFRLEL
jgi:hypothetical protein